MGRKHKFLRATNGGTAVQDAPLRLYCVIYREMAAKGEEELDDEGLVVVVLIEAPDITALMAKAEEYRVFIEDHNNTLYSIEDKVQINKEAFVDGTCVLIGL